MIPYKNYLSFKIKNKSVYLFSDETAYGLNTVAEIGGLKYFLGNERANISTAIFAFQELIGTTLSVEELKQIMMDNYDIVQNN